MLANHRAVQGDSGVKTKALTYFLSVPSPPMCHFFIELYVLLLSLVFSQKEWMLFKAFFVSPVYHLETSGKAHADADMIHPAVLFVAHLRYMASVQEEQASWAVFGTLPLVYVSWAFPHH